jgi:hypothetical protein
MYFDREHGGGDDGPSYPKGLYADLGSDEVCLLGYISEEQSIEVATAIYHRFPDMPLKKSSPEKHFTSLGLSV